MPLPEYSGTLGIKRAAHLLRRATFGATKQQIDAYASLTPQQAVDNLFRQSIPDPLPPVDPKTGQEWMTSVTSANSDDADLEKYFLGWFLAQMLSSGVPLNQSLAYSAREKIVMFLHTHFTTIKSKVGSSRALYFQNQLFRLYALDALETDPAFNFKELTVKVSVDNAMLRLLDGSMNVKGSPNENYARELLELYSIGRGLEGTLPPSAGQGDYVVYTEQDVQEAAKVLSGWDFDNNFDNLDPDTNLPRGRVKGSSLNAFSHDNSVKTFSARFNNATIQGDTLLMSGGNPSEESAMDEIRQLIDLIYSKEETAKNICWKIYRYYVYAPHEKYDPVNLVGKIDGEIIPTMVDTFVNGGYKIQPVIENLLRSQHFYDSVNADVKDDNFGGIIKSPIDLVIGTLRTFSFSLPEMTSDPAGFYEATEALLGKIEEQGMNFYEPYDVAGYEAYHQFPIYHRFWITPNTLANRYKFLREVISEMEGSMFHTNAYDYVNNNFNVAAPDARTLIVALATYFFPVSDNLDFDDATDSGLTTQRMNYFKERFLQDFDEVYWTTTWNNGGGEAKDWLEILFNTMLQSPEYQLA